MLCLKVSFVCFSVCWKQTNKQQDYIYFLSCFPIKTSKHSRYWFIIIIINIFIFCKAYIYQHVVRFTLETKKSIDYSKTRKRYWLRGKLFAYDFKILTLYYYYEETSQNAF